MLRKSIKENCVSAEIVAFSTMQFILKASKRVSLQKQGSLHKHFKKFYNGKPTKRYLKSLEKINDAERFSASDIERLLMM